MSRPPSTIWCEMPSPVSRNLVEDWDDDKRQPCPYCGETRTLEMLESHRQSVIEETRRRAERRRLERELGKLKGMLGEQIADTGDLSGLLNPTQVPLMKATIIMDGLYNHNYPRGLDVPYETCISCGAIYDPFARFKAYKLADLIEEARGKHPLQRLAYATEHDPMIEDLPPLSD